jgi:hypothetical protein
MTTLSRKISAEVHLTHITNIWFFKLLKINNNTNLKYVMSYYCGIVLSVKVCNMDNVLVWHSEVYVWRK